MKLENKVPSINEAKKHGKIMGESKEAKNTSTTKPHEGESSSGQTKGQKSDGHMEKVSNVPKETNGTEIPCTFKGKIHESNQDEPVKEHGPMENPNNAEGKEKAQAEVKSTPKIFKKDVTLEGKEEENKTERTATPKFDSNAERKNEPSPRGELMISNIPKIFRASISDKRKKKILAEIIVESISFYSNKPVNVERLKEKICGLLGNITDILEGEKCPTDILESQYVKLQVESFIEQLSRKKNVTEDLTFDLLKFLYIFETCTQEIKKLNNGIVVFFIGPSGSGKSTTIQYLMGNIIEKTKLKRVVEIKRKNRKRKKVYFKTVLDCSSPTTYGFTIGHEAHSETKSVDMILEKKSNLILCDTPGSGDTEGMEVDFMNQLKINSALKKCKKIIPVIVISINHLSNPREGAKNLGKLILRMVKENNEKKQDNLKKFLESSLIWFTGSKESDTSRIISIVADSITEIENLQSEGVGNLKKIFEHIQNELTEHLLNTEEYEEEIDEEQMADSDNEEPMEDAENEEPYIPKCGILCPLTQKPEKWLDILKKTTPLENPETVCSYKAHKSSEGMFKIEVDKIKKNLSTHIKNRDFLLMSMSIDILEYLEKLVEKNFGIEEYYKKITSLVEELQNNDTFKKQICEDEMLIQKTVDDVHDSYEKLLELELVNYMIKKPADPKRFINEAISATNSLSQKTENFINDSFEGKEMKIDRAWISYKKIESICKKLCIHGGFDFHAKLTEILKKKINILLEEIKSMDLTEGVKKIEWNMVLLRKIDEYVQDRWTELDVKEKLKEFKDRIIEVVCSTTKILIDLIENGEEISPPSINKKLEMLDKYHKIISNQLVREEIDNFKKKFVSTGVERVFLELNQLEKNQSNNGLKIVVNIRSLDEQIARKTHEQYILISGTNLGLEFVRLLRDRKFEEVKKKLNIWEKANQDLTRSNSYMIKFVDEILSKFLFLIKSEQIIQIYEQDFKLVADCLLIPQIKEVLGDDVAKKFTDIKKLLYSHNVHLYSVLTVEHAKESMIKKIDVKTFFSIHVLLPNATRYRKDRLLLDYCKKIQNWNKELDKCERIENYSSIKPILVEMKNSNHFISFFKEKYAKQQHRIMEREYILGNYTSLPKILKKIQESIADNEKLAKNSSGTMVCLNSLRILNESQCLKEFIVDIQKIYKDSIDFQLNKSKNFGKKINFKISQRVKSKSGKDLLEVDLETIHCWIVDLKKFGDQFVEFDTGIQNFCEQILTSFQSHIDTKSNKITALIKSRKIHKIAVLLCDLKKISCKIGYLHEYINNKITRVLEEIETEDYTLIIDLGLKIEVNMKGPYGRSLIQDHPQFRSLVQKMFNNSTKTHGIEYAIDELGISTDNLTIGKPSSSEKKILKKAYDQFREKYISLVNKHLYVGKEGIQESAKDEMGELKRSIMMFEKNTNKEGEGWIMGKFRHAIRFGKSLLGVPGIKGLKEEGKQLSNWNKTVRHTIPIILAHIFAFWSLAKSETRIRTSNLKGKSKKEQFDENTNSLMKPHPVQVLSILRLLGFGNKSTNKLQHHFIQIGTGEGKSVTLAVSATIFAYFGFEVDCVCYSDYLQKRDFEAFKFLFNHFEVLKRIKYQTIGGLCGELINERGDVSKLFQNFMIGNLKKQLKKKREIKNQENRILLIDEVDIFFSESFYGKTLNRVTHLTQKESSDLVLHIWKSNHGLKKIKKSPEYIAATKIYKDFTYLLDEWIIEMLYAKENYKFPPYRIIDRDIYYKHMDSYSNTISYGYKTTFANLIESKRGKVMYKTPYLEVGCGNFSYASIPKRFGLIVGVTGTLRMLSDTQKKIIKDYGIDQYSYMPTMFNTGHCEFFNERDVSLQLSHVNWMLEISNSIISLKKKRRPVIVIFETLSLLEKFMKSEYGCKAIGKVSTITPQTDDDIKQHNIRSSGGMGKITLITREFGRGTDFQCFDEDVDKNGGVHIMQTFFSEDITEQVQIKGRTARQNRKGSYSLVLNLDDLKKIGFTKETYNTAKKNDNLYEKIEECRDKYYSENARKLNQSMQESERKHKLSLDLVDILLNYTPSKKHAAMEIFKNLRE